MKLMEVLAKCYRKRLQKLAEVSGLAIGGLAKVKKSAE
jgi:hypothetical protein